MSPEKLRELFPNASEEFIRRNASIQAIAANHPRTVQAGSEAHAPEPKQAIRHETVGEVPRAEDYPTGFYIRIEIRRQQLYDDDNLCTKYFTDSCRYAGLIPDDAPGLAKIETFQTKVNTEAEEATIIEIFPVFVENFSKILNR